MECFSGRAFAAYCSDRYEVEQNVSGLYAIQLNGQTLAAGLNWQDVNGFFEDIAAKERLTFADAYYFN